VNPAYSPVGKFLHVSFVWNGVPKVQELEPVFNQALDWLRYGSSWILWTNTDAESWYARIAPHITVNDRVFVCELNTNNKQGWMDKFAWEWLNKNRATYPPPEQGH
jgi:hypothetical protein